MNKTRFSTNDIRDNIFKLSQKKFEFENDSFFGQASSKMIKRFLY